jgi:hypothetical protein
LKKEPAAHVVEMAVVQRPGSVLCTIAVAEAE